MPTAEIQYEVTLVTWRHKGLNPVKEISNFESDSIHQMIFLCVCYTCAPVNTEWVIFFVYTSRCDKSNGLFFPLVRLRDASHISTQLNYIESTIENTWSIFAGLQVVASLSKQLSLVNISLHWRHLCVWKWLRCANGQKLSTHSFCHLHSFNDVVLPSRKSRVCCTHFWEFQFYRQPLVSL